MNTIDPKSKPHIDHEALRLNKKPYPKKTIAQLETEHAIDKTFNHYADRDHEAAFLKAKGKLPKDT